MTRVKEIYGNNMQKEVDNTIDFFFTLFIWNKSEKYVYNIDVDSKQNK